MSNGKYHQRESIDLELPVPPPKQRRRPPAAERRTAEGGGGGGGGGGDERSVVELETDADGMDDGYRCAAAPVCAVQCRAVLCCAVLCRAALQPGQAMLCTKFVLAAGHGSHARLPPSSLLPARFTLF